jgi:hypothetical protein
MTVNMYIYVQTRILYVYVTFVTFVMIALQTAETDLWLLRDMLISGKYKTLFMLKCSCHFHSYIILLLLMI